MSDETTTPIPFSKGEPIVPKPLTERLQNGAPPTDAELEMSIFADGFDVAANGKPVYALSIPYGPYTFKCKLLDEEGIAYVEAENKAIGEESKALEKLPPEAQQEATNAIAARSVAKDRWVIEQAVTGWSRKDWSTPVPFTPENRDRVGKHVWSSVADDIYAKSKSGRAKSDAATNF